MKTNNLNLDEKIRRLKHYLQEDAPEIIGTEAVNFFQESFQNEGFTDKTLQKWKEVKRRLNARSGERKAAASRPILTGETGELADSITYHIQGTDAVISSDKPYAKAHNEGTDNAGRNHNVSIPQRRFVGPSETLDQTIMDIIEADIDRILKHK